MLYESKKTFYSREWIFSKLNHLLEQRIVRLQQKQQQCCSGVLLLGGPGAGKTTFCRELVAPTRPSQHCLSQRVLAHHFISVDDPATLSVSSFVAKLVEQLSESKLLSSVYSEKISEKEVCESLEPARLRADPDDAFKKAVLFPLLELEAPSVGAVLLIIDSLDEPQALAPATTDLKRMSALVSGATDISAPEPECTGAYQEDSDASTSIAELIANYYHLLPTWLVPVLTLRRSNKAMARLFTGFKKIVLDDIRRASVVRDVQQYILCRLEQEPMLRRHLTRETAPSLNLLHIKSHGCLLYVETVLDGVTDGSVLLRDIPEIPGTLNGLNLWLCQRLFSRRSWDKVRPILAGLLAARSPPTYDQIYSVALTQNPDISFVDFKKRLNFLSKLLLTSTVAAVTTYRIFHSSFAEWLTDVKHCTQRFLVDVAEGHARWSVCLATGTIDAGSSVLDELSYHLSRVCLQAPLETWHLPLWLLWTKTPLPDSATLQVMVSSLGHLQKDEVDEEEHVDFLSPLLDGKSGVEVAETQIEALTEEVDQDRVSDEPEKCIDQDQCQVDVEDDDEDDEEDYSELFSRRDSFRFKLRENSMPETDDPEQTLFYAIQLGHVSAAKKLTSRYRDLLSSGCLRHALSVAARQGHAPLVSVLVEAGADPDSADAEGWTPLRAAAWGGHAPAVQVLLRSGAQVDACDSEGRTALRAAAWAGHEQVVNCLLAAGAKVDGHDRQGRTPLIAAAYMGHADIVAALLEAGAGINHADGEGRTALSVAVLSIAYSRAPDTNESNRQQPDSTRKSLNRYPRSSLLQKRRMASDTQKPSDECSSCETLPHRNVDEEEDNEAVETVAILLEYRADVNHQDNEGMTPLLVAAFEGRRAACELLLEADADVDQADHSGRTPLLAAASMGHSRIVELLLFWGCYVDSIDAEGRTVLSVAAAQVSVAIPIICSILCELLESSMVWSILTCLFELYHHLTRISTNILHAGQRGSSGPLIGSRLGRGTP